MKKRFYIKAFNIDYIVDASDVTCDIALPYLKTLTDADIEQRIADVKSQLKDKINFTIDVDDVSDLEFAVSDYIVDKTGWLINGCEFSFKEITPKPVTLLDIHKKEVHVGDTVTLLAKYYGYRHILCSMLVDAVYEGLGRWGYEFSSTKLNERFRYKSPDCVLYKTKKKSK